LCIKRRPLAALHSFSLIPTSLLLYSYSSAMRFYPFLSVLTLAALVAPTLSQPLEQAAASPSSMTAASSSSTQDVMQRPLPKFNTLAKYIDVMTQIVSQLESSFVAGSQQPISDDFSQVEKPLSYFALTVKDATVALAAGTAKINHYDEIQRSLKNFSDVTVPLLQMIPQLKVSGVREDIDTTSRRLY
jgi:hypothetical protein